jgi:hypothetical protein
MLAVALLTARMLQWMGMGACLDKTDWCSYSSSCSINSMGSHSSSNGSSLRQEQARLGARCLAKHRLPTAAATKKPLLRVAQHKVMTRRLGMMGAVTVTQGRASSAGRGLRSRGRSVRAFMARFGAQ